MTDDDRLAAAMDGVFEACRDGTGPYALYGRLAPVYELVMADADDHYDAQFRIVRRAMEGSGTPLSGEGSPSVLEAGCGVGGLLARLTDAGATAVGLDTSPGLLAFARRRTGAPVVAGDARRPPLTGPFDAAVSVAYRTAGLTGEDDPAAFAGATADLLAPGGTLVVDALAEPRAILDDPRAGSAGGYRVDRTVVAGDVGPETATMAVEHDLTDVETGETASATEDLTVRLFDRATLRDLLVEAGFTDVAVRDRPDEPGGLVATARAE